MDRTLHRWTAFDGAGEWRPRPFKQLVWGQTGTPNALVSGKSRMGIVPMRMSLAVLLVVASARFGYAQGPKTWDGFVTDTHCGTNCQRTSAMTPDRACVRLCVKRGSKYGLWSGDHVYTLEPQSKASKFAAENVRVTGNLSNDTIQIESIALIKQQPTHN
jgi:hypothetical protein